VELHDWTGIFSDCVDDKRIPSPGDLEQLPNHGHDDVVGQQHCTRVSEMGSSAGIYSASLVRQLLKTGVHTQRLQAQTRGFGASRDRIWYGAACSAYFLNSGLLGRSLVQLHGAQELLQYE
jgi:hypothetical protein